MCELLGTEPVEDQIPVGREDLNPDTQSALFIYDKLQANWEGFTGQYLGKDLSLVPYLVKFYEFDKSLEWYIWDIIPIIDSIVAKDISEQMKRKSKSTNSNEENVIGQTSSIS